MSIRPISRNFPSKKFVNLDLKMNSKESVNKEDAEKIKQTSKRIGLSTIASNLNCSLGDQGPEIIWDDHSPSPSRQHIKRLSGKASIEPLSNILNVAIKEPQPSKHQAPSTLMDMWMAEENDNGSSGNLKHGQRKKTIERRPIANNPRVTRSRTKKLTGFKTELLQFMQSVTDVQGEKTSQKTISLASCSSAMVDCEFEFDDLLDNISDDQLQLSTLTGDNQRHHPNSTNNDGLIDIDDEIDVDDLNDDEIDIDDLNGDELNDILSMDDNNDDIDNKNISEFDDLSVLISDDDDDLINAVVSCSDQLSTTTSSKSPPNHSTPCRPNKKLNNRATPISSKSDCRIATPRRSPRFQTSGILKANQNNDLDDIDDLDDDCLKEMDEIEKNSQQPSSLQICSREEINRKRQLAQMKLKSKRTNHNNLQRNLK